MPTYYNPATSYDSGGMDRETGQNIPGALWQRLMDAIAHVSGTTGSVSCRATHNANQSIANATATALALNGENYDTEGFHDNATNNSRLTVPTGHGGKYAMKGCVQWAANATGQRHIYIRLNGATILGQSLWDAAASGVTIQTVVADYALAAGDYIELIVLQTSGGALNAEALNGMPWLSIAKV